MRLLQAVAELNEVCGHGHVPTFHDGFAQYVGPWCPPWARLVADQREARRKGSRSRGESCTDELRDFVRCPDHVGTVDLPDCGYCRYLVNTHRVLLDRRAPDERPAFLAFLREEVFRPAPPWDDDDQEGTA